MKTRNYNTIAFVFTALLFLPAGQAAAADGSADPQPSVHEQSTAPDHTILRVAAIERAEEVAAADVLVPPAVPVAPETSYQTYDTYDSTVYQPVVRYRTYYRPYAYRPYRYWGGVTYGYPYATYGYSPYFYRYGGPRYYYGRPYVGTRVGPFGVYWR